MRSPTVTEAMADLSLNPFLDTVTRAPAVQPSSWTFTTKLLLGVAVFCVVQWCWMLLAAWRGSRTPDQ